MAAHSRLPPTAFAFGENGGYLLACGKTYKSHNLPAKLQAALSTDHVIQIYHAAIGAADAYFLSYANSHGESCMEWDKLPDKLTSWLDEKDAEGARVRVIPKIRMALGGKGQDGKAFWASDGRDVIWRAHGNLEGALKRYQEAEERFRIMSIGAGGSYVMISDKDLAMWEMSDDKYPELKNLMGEWSRDQDVGGPGFNVVKDIYLNPHRKNHAIVAFNNGSITSTGIPPEAVKDMQVIQGCMTQPLQRHSGIQRKPVNGSVRVAQTPQTPKDNTPVQPRGDWAKFFQHIDNTPSEPVELEGSTPLTPPSYSTQQQSSYFFPRSYNQPEGVASSSASISSFHSVSPQPTYRSLPTTPSTTGRPLSTSSMPLHYPEQWQHNKLSKASPPPTSSARAAYEAQMHHSAAAAAHTAQQPFNQTSAPARPGNAAKQAYEATLEHMRATQGQLPAGQYGASHGGVAASTTSSHAHFGGPGSAKPAKLISPGKARYEAEMAAAQAAKHGRSASQQNPQRPPPQQQQPLPPHMMHLQPPQQQQLQPPPPLPPGTGGFAGQARRQQEFRYRG